MRIDPLGFVHQMEQVSPEVHKAQRMAELEQIAKYRALKLQKYKDWADPVLRQAWQDEAKYQERFGRELFEATRVPYEKIGVRENAPKLTTTPIYRAPTPAPKRSRLRRFVIGFLDFLWTH